MILIYETNLEAVLDNISFQGYRQFILIYSLAHNSPQTLKRSPVFQIYLCCQVRKSLSIYGATISFNEKHQPVQGWNTATTMKIEIIKIILHDLLQYIEKLQIITYLDAN